ncbi:harpin-induced like protein 24 [Zostera marina]|uniref:Harpin-induced like protein 24 n=1 Tax=Zostera marina TaxID=29655 RepID=A0A0K9PDL3_ZOSMR|nr:harpin-induced like protein 24 [Zostera marina]
MSDGLNGAYYGPSVPTERKRGNYRSVGSASSCCCSPCSILCSLFKFLISIVIIIGLLVLVLWLVFRPNQVKANVEQATLSKFNLENNTLFYNLDLDLSIRNPNRRVSIYFDRLEAETYYDGYRFGFDDKLPKFLQGHKNTTIISPKFSGQQIMVQSTTVGATFEKEKDDGSFYVDLKIRTKVRFKVWFIKTNTYKPDIKCQLKLPVSSESPSSPFTRTKCKLHFF